jgi:hypothetical protein
LGVETPRILHVLMDLRFDVEGFDLVAALSGRATFEELENLVAAVRDDPRVTQGMSVAVDAVALDVSGLTLGEIALNADSAVYRGPPVKVGSISIIAPPESRAVAGWWRGYFKTIGGVAEVGVFTTYDEARARRP